jgi:hypothetical protein
MKITLACLFTLALTIPPVGATDGITPGESGPIEGYYMLYSLEPGDTAPVTKDDAKLNLIFSGDLAKKVYESIASKEKKEPEGCVDHPVFSRQIGNLICQRQASSRAEKVDDYECSIGLDLKSGKNKSGWIC